MRETRKFARVLRITTGFLREDKNDRENGNFAAITGNPRSRSQRTADVNEHDRRSTRTGSLTSRTTENNMIGIETRSIATALLKIKIRPTQPARNRAKQLR
jgi:hypothetical protein